MFASDFGRRVLRHHGWRDGMELGKKSKLRMFSGDFEQQILRKKSRSSMIVPWPSEENESPEKIIESSCPMCFGTGRYGFSLCVWCNINDADQTASDKAEVSSDSSPEDQIQDLDVRLSPIIESSPCAASTEVQVTAREEQVSEEVLSPRCNLQHDLDAISLLASPNKNLALRAVASQVFAEENAKRKCLDIVSDASSRARARQFDKELVPETGSKATSCTASKSLLLNSFSDSQDAMSQTEKACEVTSCTVSKPPLLDSFIAPEHVMLGMDNGCGDAPPFITRTPAFTSDSSAVPCLDTQSHGCHKRAAQEDIKVPAKKPRSLSCGEALHSGGASTPVHSSSFGDAEDRKGLGLVLTSDQFHMSVADSLQPAQQQLRSPSVTEEPPSVSPPEVVREAVREVPSEENPRCCGMAIGDKVYVHNTNRKSAVQQEKGVLVKVPIHRSDFWFKVKLCNGAVHCFRKNSLTSITECAASPDLPPVPQPHQGGLKEASTKLEIMTGINALEQHLQKLRDQVSAMDSEIHPILADSAK